MSAVAETQRSPAAIVTGLVRAYGDRVVLNRLNLTIERGEFVALVGQSGCGKTTLLRALAGLDCIDSGHIEAPRLPAVVFQEHRLLPWEPLWRNVTLGLPAAGARARAAAALREVFLEDRLDDWPRTLSGGQAQRVALARALAKEPQLLLLDEPFAALDALTRIKMQLLVKKLVARHQPGVLLVTHDVDEAITLADRIIVMRQGILARDYRLSQHKDTTRLRVTLLKELGVDVDTGAQALSRFVD